jgi:hypothetical protein
MLFVTKALMRRFFAFILLLLFAITQNTRQISYWECEISEYFRPGTQKCDCTRLVQETKNSAEPLSLPSRHHHAHPDELYDATESLYHLFDQNNKIIYCLLPASLTEGQQNEPDRPPIS